ncbi:MAG TPA: hypothetical protein PKM99_09500 [Thermotogota bacterium]|nr:hypothetical protein [Thermotogota bacterium]
MNIEREKKYRFIPGDILNDLELRFREKVKEGIKNRVFRQIGIIQWYLENGEGREIRIRLEIHKEKQAFRHVWTYAIKHDLDDPDCREEFEETIDFENLSDETYPPEVFPMLNTLYDGIEALHHFPSVVKKRTILLDNEEAEAVFDEFIHPDSIPSIIEVELKNGSLPESAYTRILEECGIKSALEEVTALSEYKNKNIAKTSKGKSGNPIHTRILELQNRLKGPVIVAVLQGMSLKSNIQRLIQNKEKNLESKLDFPFSEYVKYPYGKEETPDSPTIGEICDLESNAPLEYDKVKGLSAELDSLYAIQNRGYAIDEVRFFVFPGKNGKFENEAEKCPTLYPYLEKLTKRVFPQVKVSMYSLSYASDQSESVYDSFEETWQALETLENESDGREIILDTTGGQKIIGIIAALYFQFIKKPFYYVQAESSVLYEFPPSPINWDVLQIDESHAFYKQIEGRNISYRDYLKIPQPLRNLFNLVSSKYNESEPMISLLPIKGILAKYEESRKMPFGYGEELLNYIDDTEKRQWIRNKIFTGWALQWIGDQIPETVEHSQRHSKRLMEFTVNLINTIGEDSFLRGIPKSQTENFYFVLAVAMNVHDLGHTNNVWRFEDGKELHLDGLPNIVRDLHNELTVQMIEEKTAEKRFRLLEGIEKHDPSGDLRKAIVLVSRYHRGHLPIDPPEIGKEEKTREFVSLFELPCHPLREECLKVYEGRPDWTEMVIAAARWLKFIDGADVQADRTLIPEYSEIRCERTKYESLELIEELLHRTNPKDSLRGVKFQLLIAKRDLKDYNPRNGYSQIPKNLEEIGKTMETLVYKEIAEAIFSTSGNKRVAVSYEIRTLARIAFKIMQFVHFEKHKAIQIGYPRFFKEKDGDNRAGAVQSQTLHLRYVLRENLPKELVERVTAKVKRDVIIEFEKAGIAKLKGIEHLKVEFGSRPMALCQ